jgi:hypothetical protein
MQIESSSLSKEIFDNIITQEKKLSKSASYAWSVNELSNLLLVDRIKFGKKNEIENQLMRLNEKFNKKPELVDIVKFGLENNNLEEHRNNLKIITRYKNQGTIDTDNYLTINSI